MDAREKIELKKIRNRKAKKVVRRETAYFTKHEDHMNYPQTQGLGIPIGSGAMESQCSQNQNRFKRRGQFWSDEAHDTVTDLLRPDSRTTDRHSTPRNRPFGLLRSC